MTTSMRLPQVSLEDTIASKLAALADPRTPECFSLAREIIADIKDMIQQEVAAALKAKAEPESVLREEDLIKEVYTSGLHNWAICLTHKPTGFKEDRNSGELSENFEPRWKSQLQATADALNALEGRVRAELARTAGN